MLYKLRLTEARGRAIATRGNKKCFCRNHAFFYDSDGILGTVWEKLESEILYINMSQQMEHDFREMNSISETQKQVLG